MRVNFLAVKSMVMGHINGQQETFSMGNLTKIGGKVWGYTSGMRVVTIKANGNQTG
jgi:hypothetical protein